jgi:transposase InsO family protein
MRETSYYKWLKSPKTSRSLENAYLSNLLIDTHRDEPPFGYRFLADELEHQGESVSERRVWRLCSEMPIWSSFVKKSRTGKKSGPPVPNDLVQRDFSATAVNQPWFTDLTGHMTTEGTLHVCRLENAFSSRIVGHSVGDRMTSVLCESALRNANALRRSPFAVRRARSVAATVRVSGPAVPGVVTLTLIDATG